MVINVLNKKEIHNYYKNNYGKMMDYMRNKKIMAVQMVPHPVIKKYEKGNPIVIEKFDEKDTSDHKNFFYYPDKHYVDFHIIHDAHTDIIPVDIDPNKVPDSKVRKVALLVKTIMSPLTKNVEIFHSGGRGYHVIGKLNKPISTRLARKAIDSRLKLVMKMFPITTDEPPDEGEIRLDTSTFHPGGSIRVPYSINYKTGIPSRKVNI